MIVGPNRSRDGRQLHLDFSSLRCYAETGSQGTIVYNLADKDFISGTIAYGNITQDTTSEAFSYLNFSGSESTGEITGSGLDFISGAAFTVDTWIKVAALNPSLDCTFFGCGSTNATRQLLHLRAVKNNTEITFGMWNDDLTVTVGNTADEWNNYTFVMDDGAIQYIYENSILMGSRSSSDFFRGSGDWYVGDWPNVGGLTPQPFTGSIASIVVYDRALSQSEITKNYQSQYRRFGLESTFTGSTAPPPEPDPILQGLVYAYEFEDTGTTFSASTGSTAIFNGLHTNTTASVSGPDGSGNAHEYSIAQNSYSSVSHSGEFEMTGSNALTMMVDLYPTANGGSSTSNVAGFFVLETGNHVYNIGYNSANQIRARVYDDVINRDVITTATVPLNTWGRILMRYESGSVLQVHVSGSVEESGSIAVGPITNGDTNKLGFHISMPPWMSGYLNRQFQGRVDNVMVWNRKLTDAERDQLFTGNPAYTDLNSGSGG